MKIHDDKKRLAHLEKSNFGQRISAVLEQLGPQAVNKDEHMSQREEWLDLMRAMAIVYIVAFWHVDDYLNDSWQTPITEMLVYCMLNIFVFSSSRILASKYKIIETINDFWIFLKKRVVRVYPLYLGAVTLFALVFDIPSAEIWSTLLLVNMFNGASMWTLWFIGLIFVYYILLAIILYNFSFARVIMVSVFLAIFLIVLASFGVSFDKRIILYYPSFLFGLLSVKSAWFANILRSGLIVWLSLAISLVLVSLYQAGFFDFLGSVSKLALYGAGFFAVPGFVLFAKKAKGVSGSSFVQVLTYASFCAYLYHRIAFYVALKLVKPEGVVATALVLWFTVLSVFVISFYLQTVYDVFVVRLKSAKQG